MGDFRLKSKKKPDKKSCQQKQVFDFTGGIVMIYGYACCSLSEEKGQDLNRQGRELKAAGAEKLIYEREHGDAKVKPQLDLLLEAAQAGDTIMATEVNRLSRSTQQLCEILRLLSKSICAW